MLELLKSIKDKELYSKLLNILTLLTIENSNNIFIEKNHNYINIYYGNSYLKYNLDSKQIYLITNNPANYINKNTDIFQIFLNLNT